MSKARQVASVGSNIYVSPQGTGTGQGGSVMENYRLDQIAKTNVAPLPVSPQGTGTGQGGSVMENYRLNQITVQIDGKTIATALQDQSLSGNNTAVRRTGGW